VLTFDKFCVCVGAQTIIAKKQKKKFGHFQKRLYLCNRYPENNLFTLEN